MKKSEIVFGSFLTYTPRGISKEAKYSQTITYKIKQNGLFNTGSEIIPIAEYYAKLIKEKITELSFTKFFSKETILVPASKHAPLESNSSIWVPKLFADELINASLGRDIGLYLERIYPIKQSSKVIAKERPKAIDHYNSIKVIKPINEPNEILVIDDVITRGATLLGTINKLTDAFPNAKINGFALVRTISNAHDFNKIEDPCIGTVTLRGDQTSRRP